MSGAKLLYVVFSSGHLATYTVGLKNLKQEAKNQSSQLLKEMKQKIDKIY